MDFLNGTYPRPGSSAPSEPSETPLSQRPSWLEWTLGLMDGLAWVLDAEERVLALNGAALEFSARRPNLILGRSILGVMDGHGVDGRDVLDLVQEARAGYLVADVPIRLTDPCGRRIWFEVGVQAVPADLLGERCFLVTARNEERRKRLQTYLSEAASGGSRVPETTPLQSLTRRETEVLDLLARGQDARTISAELKISYATVRNHIRRILGKLGVHSISQAVARYLIQL